MVHLKVDKRKYKKEVSRKLLVLVSDEDEALRIREDSKKNSTLSRPLPLDLIEFPFWEQNRYQTLNPSLPIRFSRIAALHQLAFDRKGIKVVITSLQALRFKTWNLDEFKNRVSKIQKNEDVPVKVLPTVWIEKHLFRNY